MIFSVSLFELKSWLCVSWNLHSRF